MYRPPRSRSTADGDTGLTNQSAAAPPFAPFAPGRVEALGDLDQSQRRRSPVDVMNGEEFDGHEAYTGAMDAGYYTDLLVNGLEQSQPVTPPSACGTAKSSQGRSKNFREEEDILLVSAWLNVGMDPIQGVDQTQGTFWKRIHAYFHANKSFKFESTCTESSLMNRWSGIQHDVNLFCGCLSKIETKNHSGWTVDDKITNACAMFTKEDKDRKFVYLHCWRILKDKPKWMDRRRYIGCANKTSYKKQKTVGNSSPASAPVAHVAPLDVGDEGEPSIRPDSKKKEKQKLKQRSTIEALDYLMVKKKEADNEKDLRKKRGATKHLHCKRKG